MVGDITEMAAWNMACENGTTCRSWDSGVFIARDSHGHYWYRRRRDDSWTEAQKAQEKPGLCLKRAKRLWKTSAYPTNTMLGENTEFVMWGKAVHYNIKCAEWDKGGFTIVEEGFKNRYERESDGSWSMVRTVPIKGSW
jgi:hypothetical protein